MDNSFSSSQSDAPVSSNVRPVTVLQCIKAVDNGTMEFAYQGITFHHVTMIGQVSNIDTSNPPRTDFIFSDESGTINCYTYSETLPQLANNDYIRIFGTVSSFNDRRQIQCLKITKVTNFNEVTMHGLQVIRFFLKSQQTSEAPVKSASTTSQATQMESNANTFQVLQGSIASAVNSSGGMSREAILQAFSGTTSPSVLQSAIDTLTQHGFLSLDALGVYKWTGTQSV